MNLLFAVGRELSVGQVVALCFVPAALFVGYVLWSDRSHEPEEEDAD